MNISVDTVNAAMSLAGGVLALLASLVAAFAALLPKNDPLSSIRIASKRIVSFFPAATGLLSALFTAGLNLPIWGFWLMVLTATASSILFIRGREPASRGEIYSIVAQISLTLTFALALLLGRIVGIIENLLNAINK